MYDLLNRVFCYNILYRIQIHKLDWYLYTWDSDYKPPYNGKLTLLIYFHYSVNRGYFKKYSWTADYFYHPSSQLTLIAWLDNNVLIEVRRQLSSKTYVTGHSAEFCDPIDLITIHSGNRIGFLCIAWETVSFLENSFNSCLLYNRNS